MVSYRENIDLNVQTQVHLLAQFKRYYDEMPQHFLTFFPHSDFSYCDGIFYYCFLRLIKPKRVIEVGVGNSSKILMFVNKKYFNNNIDCLFIDKNDTKMKRYIPNNQGKINNKLENVNLRIFDSLKRNDLLFIDTSHKEEDVGFYLHKILPILNEGVYIHIHDIFYPWIYIPQYIEEGRGYTELFELRYFLESNTNFKIMFFNHYIQHKLKILLEEDFPLVCKSTGGSIYIKKM